LRSRARNTFSGNRGGTGENRENIRRATDFACAKRCAFVSANAQSRTCARLLARQVSSPAGMAVMGFQM
jgi:hypothetical protein